MKKIGFAMIGTVMGLMMPAQLAFADVDQLPPLPALTAQWMQWPCRYPMTLTRWLIKREPCAQSANGDRYGFWQVLFSAAP
jgi:hypothetical protein